MMIVEKAELTEKFTFTTQTGYVMYVYVCIQHEC
jgi:hypothetical protein